MKKSTRIKDANICSVTVILQTQIQRPQHERETISNNEMKSLLVHLSGASTVSLIQSNYYGEHPGTNRERIKRDSEVIPMLGFWLKQYPVCKLQRYSCLDQFTWSTTTPFLGLVSRDQHWKEVVRSRKTGRNAEEVGSGAYFGFG